MLAYRELTKISVHPLVAWPGVRRGYEGLWFWAGTLAASLVPGGELQVYPLLLGERLLRAESLTLHSHRA